MLSLPFPHRLLTSSDWVTLWKLGKQFCVQTQLETCIHRLTDRKKNEPKFTDSQKQIGEKTMCWFGQQRFEQKIFFVMKCGVMMMMIIMQGLTVKSWLPWNLLCRSVWPLIQGDRLTYVWMLDLKASTYHSLLKIKARRLDF